MRCSTCGGLSGRPGVFHLRPTLDFARPVDDPRRAGLFLVELNRVASSRLRDEHQDAPSPPPAQKIQAPATKATIPMSQSRGSSLLIMSILHPPYRVSVLLI